MTSEVRIELDTAAIEDLMFDEEAEELALDVAEVVAERAAALAPKRTGAGAASIHAEPGLDGDSAYADVSWDKAHFYIGFAETGTEKQAATPFLRPALDSTRV